MKLESERCFLRTLEEEDAPELTSLIVRNKKFWTIHEPLHSPEFYTEKFQLKRIIESVHQMSLGREYSFGIFLKETGDLIGHISIYSIKRLPFSSAFIGYSLDERFTRKGLTTEAVKRVSQFGFEDLELHRIEAYVSPANEGSYHVLENADYSREGLLKEILYINGKWVDHYLYAKIESEH
ncbi:alanine acetyltransferase [Kurthia zopfii]|uniref:Ribosomal N-acetyltransferase YdaF n=1 Tax=Kurthia zopfii TaxID=1650 RepID=A0A8B4QDP5_9BACL|nr:GNAT family protein [Kurthia zopfii]PWI22461.1 N-acetyltransferase [Kurthia zopfii]TDR38812.1 ribosomal-protein-alanine N-acetyltransferase [Kurthia zopfii]GEK31536.1 alanine acetyltransferase [Kurthia zopfii]STX10718.1 Putative ribosomal N-acetyltransferase YdaF [Kurthia zopfii]